MHIVTLFGVPIYLGGTFPVLAAMLVGGSLMIEGGINGVVEGVLRLVFIFLSLVCHEFGHIIVAKCYGNSAKKIVFGMVGATVHFEDNENMITPWQECQVSGAGPLVSLLLGLIFMVVGMFCPAGLVGTWSKHISLMNMFFAFVNLLPAFPLDGGRILHACLLLWLDKKRAMQIAATIGQLFAVVFVVAAFAIQIYGLVILGVFIWRQAQSQLRYEEYGKAAA